MDQHVQRVNEFFRSKPADYFKYIKTHRSNVMEVYLKDNIGHRGNPSNRRLNGLFFYAHTEAPNNSMFGDTRLLVPSTIMFNQSTNLYFADFYCNHISHYITLVIAKPHSETDSFCSKYLHKLDILDNPFLILKLDSVTDAIGVYMPTLNDRCYIEVYCTESLNLSHLLEKGARFMSVPSSCSSIPGGIERKNKCVICDI